MICQEKYLVGGSQPLNQQAGSTQEKMIEDIND
jgi:hypothetical protein